MCSTTMNKVWDAQFAFNIIKKFFKRPALSNLFRDLTVNYNLRGYRLFQENTAYTNVRYFSTIPRLMRLWHLLPEHIMSQPRISVFNRLVKEKLFVFA